MEDKKKFWKYLLFPAIGFAIGGAFWGWECYLDSFTDKVISLPFSNILGALWLGVFGGIFTLLISKKNFHWKKITGVLLGGTLGILGTFLIPVAFFWPVVFLGGPVFYIIALISVAAGRDISRIFPISSVTPVASLWFAFLLLGLVISIIYSFFLRVKVKPVIWRGALGVALASFFSPIIVNIIFQNLFSKYLITFSLIGFIFGLFLGWGLWKTENAKETDRNRVPVS